jgi:CheY-like chemotaxis protein
MKKTILIVDDEYAIVETLVDLLEEAGHTCVSAANGRDGVELAKEKHPDLIVMDVMMPVMDGREALQVMSHDPELSKIPVILMSAAPRSVALPEELDEHVAYLKKPFDLHEFLRTIAEKLEA